MRDKSLTAFDRFPELRGQRRPEITPVSIEAERTVHELLGGGPYRQTQSPMDLLRTLLWVVPGDGYARRTFNLETERNQVVMFDAQGRGRSLTVLRADTTDWSIQFEGGDVLPGDELPVGTLIELRGFRRIFLTNPAGNGWLSFAIETSSVGG